MRAAADMPDLASMRPFDSCVSLVTGFPWHLTAERLLGTMDRYGIAEALVHDQHARLLYPREHGNRRLLDALRGHPRLHPVWVIEPPKQSGRDPARRLVGEMVGAGVRAARFPLSRIAPLPWVWKDLCDALEERHVPCFLDFGGVSTLGCPDDTGMNGVRDIALQHPGLPLVFSHVMGGLGIHPAIPHLLRRTPNTYLDITGILEYWRETARDVGPERVLFATGLPHTDPGILVSGIQYAHGFDAAAKRRMYGDNLRELLGRVS